MNEQPITPIERAQFRANLQQMSDKNYRFHYAAIIFLNWRYVEGGIPHPRDWRILALGAWYCLVIHLKTRQ